MTDPAPDDDVRGEPLTADDVIQVGQILKTHFNGDVIAATISVSTYILEKLKELAAVRPLIEQRDESITQLRTDLTNETKRANQWATRHTELVERLTKAVVKLEIAPEDQARSTGEGLLVSSLVGEIKKLRTWKDGSDRLAKQHCELIEGLQKQLSALGGTMTSDLKPGIEFDIEVARKVFGETVVEDEVNYRGWQIECAGRDGYDLPEYSTCVGKAFRVVERMREQHEQFCCMAETSHGWLVSFDSGSAKSKSLPEAICRAALEALKQ